MELGMFDTTTMSDTRKERFVQIRLRLLMMKSLVDEAKEFTRSADELERLEELENSLTRTYEWFFEND